MQWFRSNRGWIVGLAFAALALQFVLSFGHLHLGRTATGAAWAALAVPTATGKHLPPVVPPPRSNTTDEYCAVCASISLANSALSPLVVALMTPVVMAPQLPWPEADVRPVAIAHLLFSARAPPRP
jgi:hypothetical protein